MCAKSDPPPSKNADFDRFRLILDVIEVKVEAVKWKDLNGNIVRLEHGSNVDEKMKASLPVFLAEYRNSDLLFSRRVSRWAA